MDVKSSNGIRVVVLAGGPDAEREVSLMSGKAIAAALRASGRFAAVGYQEIDRLTGEELAKIKADVIFPALHGPWGEGGELQRLLEADGRSFVGSGSAAAELAMDKVRTKEVARKIGVPTPEWCVLEGAGAKCGIAAPLVLKPIDDGSSVDVVICVTEREVEAGRKRLHGRRPKLLAERFIAGRELTVGIVGAEVNSVIEIVPNVEFYDYEAKYTRSDTKYVVNPVLPGEVLEGMKAASTAIFEAIGCRDLARVDFRVDEERRGADCVALWGMLEVNTMPGFTSHSLVPMGAAANGEEMPALCARLVEMAARRGGGRVDAGSGGDVKTGARERGKRMAAKAGG